MKKIKTIILRTAGTNCDNETVHAFRSAGGDVESIHINALTKDRKYLEKASILAIPGGFTYGDDVGSGKILANELKSRLNSELQRFISDGKLIIGICNGFQVLVKMGLLPAVRPHSGFDVQATLCLNDSGKFFDKWVYLRTARETRCVWTKDMPDVVNLPIAHAEGKFIPKNDSVLQKLKKNGQVVFRYTDVTGALAGYPHNPNGSVDDIAGVCDPTGRILGMMPHPERHMTYLQHPNWRRKDVDRKGLGIGAEIFRNGVEFAKKYL
ncbi:MAG: phosphoribosylformylglycinamidine synthase I [Candidatus Omnitrophica bacterium]|nr:phosphoribosylformylglycinamidine synthase I [Candidatus Omnitrophota bacterium]MDD5487997.1 phosphoribosylformylglycinamidine synthase I [Candidatus Omnitrophota bacterium]